MSVIQELMHRQGEAWYGAIADRLVANGWSVFPQERDGARRPGSVSGEMIRWGALKDRLPTADEVDAWSGHCATLNVALALGPVSDNAFVVDIDVLDPLMSDEILLLADDILGASDFIRIGMAPKLALFYRHSSEDGEAVPSVSKRFAECPENGLEILGAGKPITLFGVHHKTGGYFKWLHKSPLVSRPNELPLVRPHQVREFLDAVAAKFPFTAPVSAAAAFDCGEVADGADGVRLPVLSEGPWVRDEAGLIADGRFAWVSSMVARAVRWNPGRHPDAIARAIVDAFERETVPSKKWGKARIVAVIRGDVARYSAKLANR